MTYRQDTSPSATETDQDIRRFYQSIVDQPIPARFRVLFARLRKDEKELEHEG